MNNVLIEISIPHPEIGEEDLTSLTYFTCIEKLIPNGPTQEECEYLQENIRENIFISVMPA